MGIGIFPWKGQSEYSLETRDWVGDWVSGGTDRQTDEVMPVFINVTAVQRGWNMLHDS
jgi:hypothetical protein